MSKFSDLTASTALLAADVVAIASSGTSYKITATNFFASPQPIGATTPLAGTFTALTANDLTLNAANPEILGGDTDGIMYIAPSTTNALGGNILLYGDTHATKANDVEFRATAGVELHYDDSASKWDFQANALDTTGAVTFSGGGALTGTWTDLGTVTTVTINGGTITGITDLAVADGGTGSSTAADARTALGLAIGTDVQAYDAELASIAGLTSAADKLPYFTGSGTADVANFTAAGRALVDDATAGDQRTTLGLVIGTNVQAWDTQLDDIAALTATDSNFIVGNGSTWVAENPATARTSLGLGTMAVEATSAVPAMTYAGTQSYADNILDQPEIRDYAETVNAIGSTGGGTQSIDLTLGNVASLTVDTSANTFTFDNPSATGKACTLTLIITNGGSQTVNWPASVDWVGGTAPTLTTAGRDIVSFITIDGGTIWYGVSGGLDFS